MPHRRPSVALFCGARHPDPAKPLARCHSLLYEGPDFHWELVAIKDNAPPGPDLVNVGVMWLHCPNKNCGRWNAFRAAPPTEEEDA